MPLGVVVVLASPQMKGHTPRTRSCAVGDIYRSTEVLRSPCSVHQDPRFKRRVAASERCPGLE